MSSAYDPNNIFARIIRGELPCHKIYEDEYSLAFMDIMPRDEGHVLVIPKAPARNLLDISPEALSVFAPTLQKIGKAVVKAFNADGLALMQWNEKAAGQEVFHLHFHLIPRHNGKPMGRHTGTMGDHAILAQHAIRVKTAL